MKQGFTTNHPAQALLLWRILPLLLIGFATAAELRDLPYVAKGDPLQKLDLYLPNDGKTKRPVIVAIHGGGWAIGDKTNRGFVQPKTRWFNRHGFIVASVNYRLSPAVKHPTHIEDVCASIAWLQKNIGKHGGDSDKLYLLGHSAGAHLAALAAVDLKRQRSAGVDPTGIKGVILIDGACYDVPRQMRTGTPLARTEGMYVDAFGLEPKMQRDASPALRVSSKPPPFLILHVKHRTDSALQSDLLARALRKHGGTATVVPVYAKSHMSINRDFGREGDPTTHAAALFLGLPVAEKAPHRKLRNGPISK